MPCYLTADVMRMGASWACSRRRGFSATLIRRPLTGACRRSAAGWDRVPLDALGGATLVRNQRHQGRCGRQEGDGGGSLEVRQAVLGDVCSQRGGGPFSGCYLRPKNAGLRAKLAQQRQAATLSLWKETIKQPASDLGKGEVESSILSRSTSKFYDLQSFSGRCCRSVFHRSFTAAHLAGRRSTLWPPRAMGGHRIVVRLKSTVEAGSLIVEPDLICMAS